LGHSEYTVLPLAMARDTLPSPVDYKRMLPEHYNIYNVNYPSTAAMRLLSLDTHLDSSTDSPAEYCIVGIPHNTAI